MIIGRIKVISSPYTDVFEKKVNDFIENAVDILDMQYKAVLRDTVIHIMLIRYREWD